MRALLCTVRQSVCVTLDDASVSGSSVSAVQDGALHGSTDAASLVSQHIVSIRAPATAGGTPSVAPVQHVTGGDAVDAQDTSAVGTRVAPLPALRVNYLFGHTWTAAPTSAHETVGSDRISSVDAPDSHVCAFVDDLGTLHRLPSHAAAARVRAGSLTPLACSHFQRLDAAAHTDCQPPTSANMSAPRHDTLLACELGQVEATLCEDVLCQLLVLTSQLQASAAAMACDTGAVAASNGAPITGSNVDDTHSASAVSARTPTAAPISHVSRGATAQADRSPPVTPLLLGEAQRSVGSVPELDASGTLTPRSTGAGGLVRGGGGSASASSSSSNNRA
ncbi:hypothetical protein EON66_12165, partial [archaeon]